MAIRRCDLEVETILEGWGDTMNDHQVLATLRKLKLIGSIPPTLRERLSD